MRCLDTYALVEIHDANPKFSGLLDEKSVITDTTMTEFYGHLYRKYDKSTADYWHRKLAFLCRPVTRDILIKAVQFRIDNTQENLSFFDCAGYIFSLENNMRFVTGDKAFERRENVQFIRN